MANKTEYVVGYSKAAFSSHQSRTAETDASFLLPHIQPHFRILDFGCGPGTITAGLAKYVPDGQVIGVDVSPMAIAQARKNAGAVPGGWPGNLRFHCIDVLKEPGQLNSLKADAGSGSAKGNDSSLGIEEHPGALPIDWLGSFDVIFESTCLVHLPTPIKAIVNLKRFLKTGTGLFATRDLGVLTSMYSPDPTGHLARIGEALNKLARAGGGDTSTHLARDVPAWLAEAGLLREKMTISVGTVAYTTPKTRRWWSDSMAARFDQGDTIREGMIKRGILTEEACDNMRDQIVKWSEEEIGIYCCATVQVLATIQ